MIRRLVLPAAAVATLLAAACQTTPSSTSADKVQVTPERAMFLRALAMQSGNTQMLDLPGARDLLEKAAAAGSAHAMDRLGDMYRFGDGGVSKDMAKAFEWYQKEAGLSTSHPGVGAWGLVRVAEFHEYGLGGQTESSLDADEWYKKAADCARTGANAGNPSAMDALAYLLANGRGVKENDVQAWDWVIKSTDLDKAPAMLLEAQFYATGQGVDPNPDKAFQCALTAAQLGNTEAMVDVSLGFMNGTGAPVDRQAGIDWIQKAIDRGNSRAMLEMGNYYHNGQGVEASDATARTWYQKAVDQNNEVALGLMGQLIYPRDPQEALTWFTKGADAHDPGSMYWKATILINPPPETSVARNSDEAISLLLASAKAGFGPAMTRLGELNEEGRVMARNPGEALRWYRQAADAGDVEGMFRLAYTLTGPLNNVAQVPPAYAEAKQWLIKAGEGGYAPAMTTLGAIYSQGVGRANKDLDPFVGAKWYEKGAKAGDPQSMREYGELLVEGKYVSRNFPAAQEWFNKAIQLGDTGAIVDLGIMYEKGQGVPLDYAMAMREYQEADAKGEPTAKAAMAHLYQDGLGVRRDPQRAISLLQDGIQQGDIGAILALAQTYEFGKGVLIDNTKARYYYQMAANKGDDSAQAWLDYHPEFLPSTRQSGATGGAPGTPRAGPAAVPPDFQGPGARGGGGRGRGAAGGRGGAGGGRGAGG